MPVQLSLYDFPTLAILHSLIFIVGKAEPAELPP